MIPLPAYLAFYDIAGALTSIALFIGNTLAIIPLLANQCSAPFAITFASPGYNLFPLANWTNCLFLSSHVDPL